MPAAGEVRFYYDVVCPYSYLESHRIEQAEDDGLASVEWLPFELRPAPRALLDPRGDHLRVDWTRNVYRRALALGIEIHLPRYQPRSTLVLAACLWAQEAGRLRPFRRALYEAFFCEGRNIGSETEIARAAQRVELDADDAVAAAYSPVLIGRVDEIRDAAERNDVRGVPSVLTQDGRTHWGMGGLDRVLDGRPLIAREG
jgi:predicted DsbA family dithiol-disulfide isomerase